MINLPNINFAFRTARNLPGHACLLYPNLASAVNSVKSESWKLTYERYFSSIVVDDVWLTWSFAVDFTNRKPWKLSALS